MHDFSQYWYLTNVAASLLFPYKLAPECVIASAVREVIHFYHKAVGVIVRAMSERDRPLATAVQVSTTASEYVQSLHLAKAFAFLQAMTVRLQR